VGGNACVGADPVFLHHANQLGLGNIPGCGCHFFFDIERAPNGSGSNDVDFGGGRRIALGLENLNDFTLFELREGADFFVVVVIVLVGVVAILFVEQNLEKAGRDEFFSCQVEFAFVAQRLDFKVYLGRPPNSVWAHRSDKVSDHQFVHATHVTGHFIGAGRPHGGDGGVVSHVNATSRFVVSGSQQFLYARSPSRITRLLLQCSFDIERFWVGSGLGSRITQIPRQIESLRTLQSLVRTDSESL